MHDFPFINPIWLLPVTFLSFVCLQMVTRIICYIPFLRNEVRLICLQFPGPALQDGGGVFFLLVFINFPGLPYLPQITECHCPQHLWVCPNRFDRLGKCSAKWSLISPSSTDSKHPCSKLSCESQSLGLMKKLLSGTAFLMLFVTRRLPHSAESFSCHCTCGLKGGITTQ